jgi:hypothetical protein
MRTVLGMMVGVASLAIAGCGGSTTTIVEKTVVTERSSEATTYPPNLGISPATSAPDSSPSNNVRFETPSGNITCDLSSEAVHCEIFRKSFTPPVPKPPSCNLDYGHRVSVGAYGPSEFDCYGDSMSGIAEQTLGYGREIRRGRISCLSEESGLVCETVAGTGFVLSAQAAKLL